MASTSRRQPDDRDHVAGLVRDAPEAVEDQAGHGGVGPVGDLDADVGQVVDREPPGQHPGAVGLGAHRQDVLVGLVVDLADQLLEQVLDGHDALGAAVLVDDDGHLVAPGLHGAQGVEHRPGLGERRGGLGRPRWR